MSDDTRTHIDVKQNDRRTHGTHDTQIIIYNRNNKTPTRKEAKEKTKETTATATAKQSHQIKSTAAAIATAASQQYNVFVNFLCVSLAFLNVCVFSAAHVTENSWV